jgi:hypothetical protein
MPEYRVYVIGEDGHIKLRIDLDCADDDLAKEQAKSLVDSHPIEFWQSARKVATFEPDLGRWELAIYRPLKDCPLAPDVISRIMAAYEQALHTLCVKDRDDPLTEMIAKKIITQTGVHDPAKIAALAIKELEVRWGQAETFLTSVNLLLGFAKLRGMPWLSYRQATSFSRSASWASLSWPRSPFFSWLDWSK